MKTGTASATHSVTFSEKQAEMVGFALLRALREQRGAADVCRREIKLRKLLGLKLGAFPSRLDGAQERIALLEEALAQFDAGRA